MTSGIPEAYSVDDTAEALGVSRAKVYLMIKAGELFSVKLGHRRVIPKVAIEAVLRGERYDPTAAPTEQQPDYSTWPPTPSALGDDDGQTLSSLVGGGRQYSSTTRPRQGSST